MSQADEVEKRWGVMTSGGKSEMRGSLRLFGVGGLRLVEVAGPAVCIIVRQVVGGTVQIKVAAS